MTRQQRKKYGDDSSSGTDQSTTTYKTVRSFRNKKNIIKKRDEIVSRVSTRKSKNLTCRRVQAPVTIIIEKSKLVKDKQWPTVQKKGVKFEPKKEEKRIEKVYFSKKHNGIVAKVSLGHGITKIISMDDMLHEPGQIFVNYMTRLIMEDV
jgi:transposase